MQAKMLVSSIALIGGMALAMPVFAQTQTQPSPGAQPAMNSQMNGGSQDQAQGAGSMSSNQGQSANQMPAGNSDNDQAQTQDRMSASQDQAQNDQPMMHHKMRHHTRHARLRHERNGEGNGAGVMGARYGTDVAPGGGRYTRQDVAEEGPDRMSHPGVGSPRAPSNVAKGPLVRVNEAENAETARLNEQQLNGTPSAPTSR